MSPISFRFVVTAVAGAALAAMSALPAAAGPFYTGSAGAVPTINIGGGININGEHGGGGGGGGCGGGGGSGPIKIININKNLNINKNININKVVVINKINIQVAAFAQAMAEANAQAGAQVIVYGGGSYEYVNINNHSNIGAISTSGHCHMEDATVVKSIHAICVSADGREFPASHMMADTWIESAYEGEIARCIPGSRLKITIGDVVQSDQGMAGLYSKGVILQCGEREAVRHFKDGMLKCTPAMEVPDCTERTNLRKYGTGDMFFSYRSKVCAEERSASRDVDLDGGAMDGGVGANGTY